MFYCMVPVRQEILQLCEDKSFKLLWSKMCHKYFKKNQLCPNCCLVHIISVSLQKKLILLSHFHPNRLKEYYFSWINVQRSKKCTGRKAYLWNCVWRSQPSVIWWNTEDEDLLCPRMDGGKMAASVDAVSFSFEPTQLWILPTEPVAASFKLTPTRWT
jgi:hypothetical protein